VCWAIYIWAKSVCHPNSSFGISFILALVLGSYWRKSQGGGFAEFYSNRMEGKNKFLNLNYNCGFFF
jgi:hypothetical protein